MSEPTKTTPTRDRPSIAPSLLLGIALGFTVATLVFGPSCNPPELESQPLGKPSPPLPPPEL